MTEKLDKKFLVAQLRKIGSNSRASDASASGAGSIPNAVHKKTRFAVAEKDEDDEEDPAERARLLHDMIAARKVRPSDLNRNKQAVELIPFSREEMMDAEQEEAEEQLRERATILREQGYDDEADLVELGYDAEDLVEQGYDDEADL